MWVVPVIAYMRRVLAAVLWMYAAADAIDAEVERRRRNGGPWVEDATYHQLVGDSRAAESHVLAVLVGRSA